MCALFVTLFRPLCSKKSLIPWLFGAFGVFLQREKVYNHTAIGCFCCRRTGNGRPRCRRGTFGEARHGACPSGSHAAEGSSRGALSDGKVGHVDLPRRDEGQGQFALHHKQVQSALAHLYARWHFLHGHASEQGPQLAQRIATRSLYH